MSLERWKLTRLRRSNCPRTMVSWWRLCGELISELLGPQSRTNYRAAAESASLGLFLSISLSRPTSPHLDQPQSAYPVSTWLTHTSLQLPLQLCSSCIGDPGIVHHSLDELFLLVMTAMDNNAYVDEDEHVHRVYEQIADHFSATRYKVRLVFSSILCSSWSACSLPSWIPMQQSG